MKKATLLVSLFIALIIGLTFILSNQPTVTAQEKNTVQKVNHKITYEQVLKYRSAYKGTMKGSSFDIPQVKQLLDLPDAQYLVYTPGTINGEDKPILTVYNSKGEEIKEFGLELSLACPPDCLLNVVKK